MDFESINIDRIIIDTHLNLSYKTSKNEIKPFIIRTPLLYIPFGIDTIGKNYFINAQLRKSNNTDLNNKLLRFQIFLEEIEEFLKNKTNKNIKSLLRKNDKYDTIINLKIIKQKKIITEVTKNKEYFNFFKIEKNSYMVCDLYLDKLWLYDNILYYKLKIKKLDISV